MKSNVNQEEWKMDMSNEGQKEVTTVTTYDGVRHELKPESYTEFDVPLSPGHAGGKTSERWCSFEDVDGFRYYGPKYGIKDFSWSTE